MMSSVTKTFLDGSLDPSTFDHRAHLQVAYDLLSDTDYVTAATTYATGIRSFAEAAGAAQKFHVTITFAFLGLIAERMSVNRSNDFESFLLENPDLTHKDVLLGWYSRDRLTSDTARKVYLMPDLAKSPSVAAS